MLSYLIRNLVITFVIIFKTGPSSAATVFTPVTAVAASSQEWAAFDSNVTSRINNSFAGLNTLHTLINKL